MPTAKQLGHVLGLIADQGLTSSELQSLIANGKLAQLFKEASSSEPVSWKRRFALGVVNFAFLQMMFLLGGVLLERSWIWFVTPIFGVPALSLGAAVGLGVCLRALTRYRKCDVEEFPNDIPMHLVVRLGAATGIYATPFVTCWLISYFI